MPNSVDAAFRSSRENECYVFVKNKYVVVNYAPGGKKNQIIKGPDNITDGFPMFVNTVFQWKIDSSFDTEDNLAYLFSGDQCVKIDYSSNSPGNARVQCFNPYYSPYSQGNAIDQRVMPQGNAIDQRVKPQGNAIDQRVKPQGNAIDQRIKPDNSPYSQGNVKPDYSPYSPGNARLLEGPIPISKMFPCLKGTVFESGIDATMWNPNPEFVHFFKGDECCLLRFQSNEMVSAGKIRSVFKIFLGTVFEHGIDAAFNSHVHPEVYVFKGEYYVHYSFNDPNSFKNGPIKLISDEWPALRSLL
ncbi:hemopexin protein [Medicago truncatula]|uniref:Hemopexin protein n=1 Tax=Medicago truncatula TaxID=3880 RepID=A0A072UA02_MEDTR|nr:hemopexin protein [Medicago truncatula]